MRCYLIGYHSSMEASEVIRRCRTRSGLTLRALATTAGTSHSTLAAYESGSKVPTVRTLDRIVRAAGFALDAELSPRSMGTPDLPRGEELAAVIRLAEAFPARHATRLTAPVFPPPIDSRAAAPDDRTST